MPHRPRVSGTDTPEAEMDFVQILRGVLRRRKTVVITAFALIALPVLGWIIYGRRPLFESTATVHIKPSIAEMFPATRDLPVGSNLSVQMAVLESRALANEVLEAVPQETMDELMQQNVAPDYLTLLSNVFRQIVGKSQLRQSSAASAV